jgi:hypothetical protein
MRERKTATILLLLLGCLLLTACPPSGGDLVPLAQGEGAGVATTKFKDDTLVVEREGLSVRGRGLWSVADSATSVILEIVNNNSRPAVIDLDRGEMVNKESGEKLVLRSVSDETAGDGPTFLQNHVVKLEGGASRRLALEFRINSADGRSSVSRNVLGQTIALRLPVTLLENGQNGAGSGPDEVDFVLAFKYAQHAGG